MILQIKQTLFYLAMGLWLCQTPTAAWASACSCNIERHCVSPGHSHEITHSDGIVLRQWIPVCCELGMETPVRMELHSFKDVDSVTVRSLLSGPIQFLRSDRDIHVEGKEMTWTFEKLRAGETVKWSFWVRGDALEEVAVHSSLLVMSSFHIPSKICKAKLEIAKRGCETVRLGCPAQFVVAVRNVGDYPARNVVVTDHIPEGMEHSSGQRTVDLPIGCIAPGETKSVALCLKTLDRGEFCNHAIATADNAESVEAQACTRVLQYSAEIIKTGPVEKLVNHTARYTVQVYNTGDGPLTRLRIKDHLPPKTCLQQACGAKRCGDCALWEIPKLAPGQSATFELDLTSPCPGARTNTAVLDACEICPIEAHAQTIWIGTPETVAAVCDTHDPLCPCDCTVYRFRVCNKGTASDHNVVLHVELSEHLQPLKVNGATAGMIEGQRVLFQPIPELKAGQSMMFNIKARATKSGDAHLHFQLKGDSMKTPMTGGETTKVH